MFVVSEPRPNLLCLQRFRLSDQCLVCCLCCLHLLCLKCGRLCLLCLRHLQGQRGLLSFLSFVGLLRLGLASAELGVEIEARDGDVNRVSFKAVSIGMEQTNTNEAL